MATHSFNTFLRSLQDAVGQAQSAAATRHRAMLERMVEVGQNGELRVQSWSVHMPALKSDRRADTVVLPLLSLRPLIMPQVTSFSLEVDVDVETKRQRYPSGHERVRLVIPENPQDSRHQMRRLRVTLTGPQPGTGEVLIDGTLLKRLEGIPDQSVALVPVVTVRARFHSFIRFLRDRFPFRDNAIHLDLSEEDSRRLKDIQSVLPS